MGKSYLLFVLYYEYLLSIGVEDASIIRFAFDNDEDLDKLDRYFPDEPTKIYLDKEKRKYVVNAKKFRAYIRDVALGQRDYYFFLDEVQLLEDFVDTLNGFLRHDNYDVYVTGSNSRFLSKDVASELRARGEQIHVQPLSFKEFYDCHRLAFEDAYSEYSYFGGLPYLSTITDEEKKTEYLNEVFQQLYLKDLVERYDISSVESFNQLIDVLCSSIGSYTNPTNIENTFKSVLGIPYHRGTIAKHIEYLKDCFLIKEAKRYDVKGRKYIGANRKYYFIDVGLRNARLNYRQQEPTPIMENIVYNELRSRGYSIDIGILERNERNQKGNGVVKQLEIDFICTKGNRKYYIQSAYRIPDQEKRNQEVGSLIAVHDSFKKIVVVNDIFKPWNDDHGVLFLPLKEFLLNEDSLDL